MEIGRRIIMSSCGPAAIGATIAMPVPGPRIGTTTARTRTIMSGSGSTAVPLKARRRIVEQQGCGVPHYGEILSPGFLVGSGRRSVWIL